VDATKDAALAKTATADRVLFAGLFFTGFSTLLFEVSLTRVLSYAIWHHFAYVVISTALLGYGAAGSLVSVSARLRASDPRKILGYAGLGSAISGVACIAVFALLPLDPMRIWGNLGQATLFVAYQIVAIVPFFFSGLVLSVVFSTSPGNTDRLYCWDLLGAAAGCALAVVLMNLLAPPGATLVAAAGFALAAAVFSVGARLRNAAVALSAALVVASVFGARIPFTPAESKHLIPQMKHWVPIVSRWTALFHTEVLEDRGLGPPMRNQDEWGLSRIGHPNVQHMRFAINHDASAGAPLYDLRQGQLDQLDHHVLRLPYLVANQRPRVLVIGVGAGRDVVTALRYGASHVTAVELDAATVQIVKNEMNQVLTGLFHRPDVELFASEGRHFIKRSEARFDLIQLTGVDTLAAAFSGAYVLAENYLYTVEAFHDYLDHLRPGGVLSFATGDFDPANPKANGRMITVARQALLERGIQSPEQHIALIDSTTLLSELLIKESGFSQHELDALAARAQELGFVPRLLPGGVGGHPYVALATLSGPAQKRLFETMRYDLSPTTDNRPFFFAHYRWADLFGSDLLNPSHASAMGQIVLVLLGLVLTLLGGLFILGPLLPGRLPDVPKRAALGVLGYFLAIGLGFMLFEISLMQRFVLFLGHPTYSLSITLASLLAALGVGSFLSRRWLGKERSALPVGVFLLGVLATFYALVLPRIQASLLQTPFAVRALASVLLLCPLGLVAGMFFPLGIAVAVRADARLVAWAWGINGCASVTGTVLAVMLAMSYGFQAVWMLSVAIYAAGTAALWRLAQVKTQSA
jgi:SAM-dependent methyltransferase